MAVTLTTDNFGAEVLSSDKPVLVDFWASWCGPCNMLSPIVDQVASEHPEIKVGKVNVDDQPMLAQHYGISSIPALFFFRDGKVAGTMIGAQPKVAIEQLIKK